MVLEENDNINWPSGSGDWTVLDWVAVISSENPVDVFGATRTVWYPRG